MLSESERSIYVMTVSMGHKNQLDVLVKNKSVHTLLCIK